MPFMKPQVYETDYIEIDGPHGTEIVPCDVADLSKEEIDAWPKQGDSEDNREIPGPLAMYCDNTWAWTIERKHGWIGRLSAPGYMDCTSWTRGETEAEVRAHLADLYDVHDVEENEDMSAEEPITSDERAAWERAERERE